MSDKALLVLAAALLVLCAAAGVLLVRDLGWLEQPKPIEWKFVNATLDVRRGQRVVLRPILEGIRPLRYTFLVAENEPRTDDAVAPVPHLRAGVEELEQGDWFYRPPVEGLAYCQLGARTPQEWLEEIRPVIEWKSPREQRLLLKATFGHRNGSFVAYYFDPRNPVPAFGWIRSETTVANAPPEIFFASDGGLAQLPKEDPPKEHR
jgi:hypothetical protein